MPRTLGDSDDSSSGEDAPSGTNTQTASGLIRAPLAAEALLGPAPGEEQLPVAQADCSASDTVFEIRDFTTASSFERIAHQISLKVRLWKKVLDASDHHGGEASLREDFEHREHVYELHFQLSPGGDHQASGPADGGARSTTSPPEKDSAGRSGCLLHAFPAKAHRLQRWFGVQHFLVLSVRGTRIDSDSARTVLSAAMLAVRPLALHPSLPLACFVPVDFNGRRQYVGELASGGARVVFGVDQKNRVDASLEHIEGLRSFFCRKMDVDPDDASRCLVVGARFTYLADAFEALGRDSAMALGRTTSTSSRGSSTGSRGRRGSVDQPSPVSGDGASRAEEDEEVEPSAGDPVNNLQLLCHWPSFPSDSFVDNAVYSELEPRLAPFWRLRLTRAEDMPLPLTRGVQTLLGFRKEAAMVKSAHASLLDQAPKSAFASLSLAIQESLEHLLIPKPEVLNDCAEYCLSRPISGGSCAGTRGVAPELAGLRGAPAGTLFSRYVEICGAGGMGCFKGATMLWLNVLGRLRQRWDAQQQLAPDTSPPEAQWCGEARGVRMERLGLGSCIVQQKLEMLMASAFSRPGGPESGLRPSAPNARGARVAATGDPVVAPLLLHPPVMTEDLLVQFEVVASSIHCDMERAEQLHGREVRSDAAAFKAANPKAELGDFVAFRAEAMGLLPGRLPQCWLERVWDEASPTPAADQTGPTLFEPEREAEMALHYLENVDGTQLLIQMLRTRVVSALHELGGGEIGAFLEESAHLRVLRNRAASVCSAHFVRNAGGCGSAPLLGEGQTEAEEKEASSVWAGEVEEFLSDSALGEVVASLEAFEVGASVAASLREKLPGAGKDLIEDLLTHGEAAVTSEPQRRVVQRLFDRARVLGQISGQADPGSGRALEALPHAKEFVLTLQGRVSATGRESASGAPPVACADAAGAADVAASAAVASSRRLYAEIREKHSRLAVARGLGGN